MSLFGCENKYNCIALAIVSSIIIGIITAFLRITAVITVTPAFLWVLFGIAVAYLATTLISASLTQRISGCSGPVLTSLLSGILGTVLFSTVLLGIEFAATSVIGAIITGALLLFFSLTVTSTACLIKCLASNN